MFHLEKVLEMNGQIVLNLYIERIFGLLQVEACSIGLGKRRLAAGLQGARGTEHFQRFTYVTHG